MTTCKHNKVYSEMILLSNPPQCPWICSKCGERGVYREIPSTEETYDEVLERFKNRNLEIRNKKT